MSEPESKPSRAFDQELKAILEVEKAQIKAIHSGDVDGAAASFAKDAVILFPGKAPVEGSEPIKEWIRALSADPALEMQGSPGASVVATSGDLAFTTSHYSVKYTPTAADQPKSETGVMIGIWKKEEEHWKLLRDINIPGQPA